MEFGDTYRYGFRRDKMGLNWVGWDGMALGIRLYQSKDGEVG